MYGSPGNLLSWFERSGLLLNTVIPTHQLRLFDDVGLVFEVVLEHDPMFGVSTWTGSRTGILPYQRTE